MKTTLTISLLSLSLAGFALAEGEGKKRQPGAMFQNLDKNADGKITQDEAPEKAWEHLSKRDANGDGAVSKEELAQGGRPGGAGKPGGAGGNRDFFGALDADKDGKITQAEAGERWERLGKLDKNSDGAVTKDELPQMAGRPGGEGGGAAGGRIFQFLDKDKDGKISRAEAGERWEHMGQLDKNGDGAISKEEFPQMGARPGGQGGERNPAEFFARMDQDKNGELSESEVPAQIWERLSKADRDANGSVSKEELAAARGQGGKGAPSGNTGAGKKPKRPPLES